MPATQALVFSPARLRARREALELSQFALARRVTDGVTPAAISQIERGINTPKPKTLRRLAKALDCSVEDFFEEQEAQAS